MVKLVDMPDLGSGAARRVGSSPIIRTEKASEILRSFFVFTAFLFFVANVVDKQFTTISQLCFLFLFLKS